jgi:conjugative transfer pilus assembly protein TraH
MIKRLTFGILLLFVLPVRADLGRDLQEFFNQVTDSNITPPGAYKGQEGGFYTGGSVFIRNPSRQLQFINLQLPHIEAGCRGIDLHLGGWGYINSAKMVETLKAIGANANSYLFSLAIKQVSPFIGNQMDETFAWINDANWNNINSCQAAEKLVNNAASYFHETTVRTCIQQELGSGKDYFSARESCKTQSRVNAKNKEALERGEPVIDNINVAWKAIQNNPVLKTLDNELKFLLMSLTGTVVVKTEGNAVPEVRSYISKLQTEDVIYNLSTGKNVNVYACADEHCLSISNQTITLPPDKTFVGKIYALLKGMEEKIVLDETALSPQEKAFLEATSLPVYKMLNVYSAFGRGTSLLFPSHYAEVIAMDILYRYIESGINDVLQSFQHNDLPKSLQKQFLNMVEMARSRAKDLRLMQLQKTGTVDDMVAKVQVMEKQITALVSSQVLNNRSFYGL